MEEDRILKTAQRERQKEVSEYLKSGKTKKEWCSERGIALSTFSGWLARKKKIDKTAITRKDLDKDCISDMDKKAEIKPKWVRVETLKYNLSDLNTPITVKIGGFGVLVEKNFDKAVLVEVLLALKELC